MYRTFIKDYKMCGYLCIILNHEKTILVRFNCRNFIKELADLWAVCGGRERSEALDKIRFNIIMYLFKTLTEIDRL